MVAPTSSAPTPRFEVEIIDHDDVATIEVEGSPVKVETAYVFKFNVSNAAVAERVARNVLARSARKPRRTDWQSPFGRYIAARRSDELLNSALGGGWE
jgi:hypothetical protein